MCYESKIKWSNYDQKENTDEKIWWKKNKKM